MRPLALALMLLTACDLDPPELHVFTPAEYEPMRGVGDVSVHVEFSDASETTVKLLVDGKPIDRLVAECNDDRCTADEVWNNEILPAGEHMLGIELEDSGGNKTREEHAVVLEDVLDITSLRVTNTVDEFGALEVEVYAFDDDTNAMLGCAGSRERLEDVNASDVRYQTEAILILPDGELLSSADMGTQRIRLEVWEDDDDPVCPTVPDPAGNDLIGASAARTIDEWRQVGTTSFGSVTELGVAWSRPLRTGEVPTNDPNDITFGGASCSTGRPTGTGLLLFVLALLTRRGRARRATGRAARRR